ncbi:MAG: hypothetical protein NW220_16310 [Leptolyngbyaceae cyanobacterium bins.349]|nr:hypothetical protein [Leptolyngbyaceae cyanobacterium bins.349]
MHQISDWHHPDGYCGVFDAGLEWEYSDCQQIDRLAIVGNCSLLRQFHLYSANPMTKVIANLFLTTVLLGSATSTLAQECLNCWTNPKTGKPESLDQGMNGSSPARSPNQSAQRSVIVYGRRTCGLTTRMMQQLDANRITYQFKNVDDRTVNVEMWERLRAAGLANNRSIRLPVLSVKGKTMVNATLADVQGGLR